jgi:hypothetical protein
MLKKSITYKNYNDKTVTEDYYFHLTKAELIELEVSEKGGLAEALKRIVASNDGAQIIQTFKKIILQAYGVKSEDGRRFIKSQELRDEFEQTEAYSTLFMELATDAGAAAIFVNGIVPEGLVPEEGEPTPMQIEIPKKDVNTYTREELLLMLNQKPE